MQTSLSLGQIGRRLRISGSSALALSTISTNLVRLVSTVVLSRLLAPDVYGITGLILSIFYVITMLSDVGFQAYIVRHSRSDEPDFINAVWTIHAGRGALLTIVAILLAWPLSLVLAKPELAAPLAVAALTFAIDGQASLGQLRALRQNRVQRVALMDLTVSVGQIIAAIIAAIFIRNVWAIIISMLFGSMLRVWVSYALFPGNRRAIRPDRDVTADLWRFSRVIAASSAMTLVISQVDKLAMSRIMPLSEFGTYVIASTLAAAPTAFASSYSSSIVYPAVAAAWRTDRPVSNTYYACWGKFFYLYALGGGCLIGIADLLVRLLYDPRYYGASLFLNILAFGTAMALLNRSMNDTLVGSGHQRATLELNVVRLAWLIGGGALALTRGNAMTFVATIGLIEAPAYLYGVIRLRRLGVTRWAREASIFLTIAAGVTIGWAIDHVGLTLFPNL
jgi:O-antigen/teichoic acid export membrane protein